MSNFNTKKQNTSLTKNLAGGVAYKMNTKSELASLMVTSFLCGDKYYESNDSVMDRFEKLGQQLLVEDPLFLAKASLYARDKFNMRSVSHFASSIILEDMIVNGKNKSDEYIHSIENYLAKVSMRPDDVTETIAAYKARPNAFRSKKGRIQLPCVAKRGFSRAIGLYDEYRLAKYRNADKDVSLIDAVRMSHAKATSRNRDGLKKLVDGTLRMTETWEAKLSTAGKSGSKEQVAEAKKEAWSDFVNKGERVEYFALLRNLRNIAEQADTETLSKACSLLENGNLIAKSKVLPFRFSSAYDAINSAGIATTRRNKVIRALNRAVELSLSNVPKFEGTTAILLDVSGSMEDSLSDNSVTRMCDVANLFASVLFKSNDSDIVMFSSDAEFYNPNPGDSLFTIAKGIRNAMGGTNMSAAFRILDQKYDRIIVLSDMQTWMGSYYSASSKTSFNDYKKRTGAKNCKLFSFDLSGNGSLQFPEQNVFLVAGWSDKTFDIISKMEEDKSRLVHEIEAIQL